ncbi:MAG: hypothetical protein FJ263_07890 [Planctomycetes bacterium]|nr:hypothetical protein [Planctomycetota bacterium]
MKSEIRKTKFETNSKFEYSKFGLTVVLLFVLAGCGPKQVKEEKLCAGKATAAEVVAALRQSQAESLSLQARIHCVIEIPNPQGKSEKQDFDGKIFFISPGNLCIAGEKFGRIRIGVNDKEFWVYVKPGQDTAWWGEKKDVPSCVEKLGFNPFYLAEALGQIDLNRDWTLMQQPGFDILVSPDAGGIKKVYVNCCTYRVERIEYCDVMGRLMAAADLSDYKDVPKVGMIPRMIELGHFRSAQPDLILQLRLSGISFFAPTEAQKKLFDRPSPKGYASVYHWTGNCEFVAEKELPEGK